MEDRTKKVENAYYRTIYDKMGKSTFKTISEKFTSTIHQFEDTKDPVLESQLPEDLVLKSRYNSDQTYFQAGYFNPQTETFEGEGLLAAVDEKSGK